MKSTLRLAALATLALLAAPVQAATKPAAKPAHKPLAPASNAASNWANQIVVTADGSHMFGNPKADMQLTEFVSYTCPHCAHFTREADPALRLTLVPKGQIAVTVTTLLRNPIDLTISMLTTCGDPKRFFQRHNAFLTGQDAWMGKLEKMSEEQQKRWYQGALPERMKAIASDFDFYSRVAAWGMTRTQADACFANEAVFDTIKQQQATVAKNGVNSTPSFILNGKLLDAHDWAGLSKEITAQMAAKHKGAI